MIDGRTIRGVDANNPSFVRSLRRINDQRLKGEILVALRALLFLDLDAPPARLHLHQLKHKTVPSAITESKKVNVWSIHVTANDAYKVSFTLEEGVAYLRLCDEHDVIDKHP